MSHSNKHKDKEGCSSSAERTGLQRGQRAADQCLDYQRKLCLCTADGAVQPAEAQIISYGKNSNPGEFGNMALLGYGDDKTRQWSCGGSIISDRYILTAGHCISGKLGKVKMVALGVLARSDLEKEGLIFEVKRIIPHPEFKPPSKYNDIALLEVDREIPLTRSIQPACLDVDEMDDHQGATATGWGALEYGEDNADILQKTKLYRFSDEECAAKYSEGRLLRSGINHSTQVCYGHRSHPADTCQGDSGGPLLIRNKFRCLHSIIGVTSFGSTCGMAGEPGVYTKLSSYLPWIESIVWP
ncbi:serine protease snake-like [Achroia grisella]|uniref:serine protease snake-like n=1 Tax=Achroia grisella TaxID=688607 RepID=UPI0027D2BFEC|nr:serine protease snake-like [Achroia grisella]